LSREKVFDPILRGIHAWNGLAILLLIVSSQVAAWFQYTPEATSLWRFHVWAGYALVVGLVARLTWGLNGPAHARLAAMWHWRAWLAVVRTRQLFTAPSGVGGDRAGQRSIGALAGPRCCPESRVQDAA
jgi:cytochrome b561